MTVDWLATWGGWLFAGGTFLMTVLLAYIIKPIGERGLRNESQIMALKEDHVNRLAELRREQEGRMEVLRDDQQQRLDDLRMKQVQTETTLRIYVETQTKIQQSLGRIDGNLSQVIGGQSAQAASLARLESEVGEIRRIHMKTNP